MKLSYSPFALLSSTAFIVIGSSSKNDCCVSAFAPSAFVANMKKKPHHHQGKTTELYFISERDLEPRPEMSRSIYEEEELIDYNPKKYIQKYIKTPKAVEIRDTKEDDTTVMVSGLLKEASIGDDHQPNDYHQFVFDLLNNADKDDGNENDVMFNYQRIIAHVDDVKFAKKRLMSRSARYTGLLNKLDYVESSNGETPLPTSEQLQDVTSWVAYVDAGIDIVNTVHNVHRIISLSKEKSSSIKNVAMLISNVHMLSIDEQNLLKDIIHNNAINTDNTEKDTKEVNFSILVVGEMDNRPEGKVPYNLRELKRDEETTSTTSLFTPPTEEEGTTTRTETESSLSSVTFSRNEALRIITECLQLQSSINKAFVCNEAPLTIIKNKDDNDNSDKDDDDDDEDEIDEPSIEFKLIKGLRTAGYTRTQEIDYMLRDGVNKYQMAIDDYFGTNPDEAAAAKDKRYKVRNWWEHPVYAKITKEMDEKEKIAEAKLLQEIKEANRLKEEEKIDYASKFE